MPMLRPECRSGPPPGPGGDILSPSPRLFSAKGVVSTATVSRLFVWGQGSQCGLNTSRGRGRGEAQGSALLSRDFPPFSALPRDSRPFSCSFLGFSGSFHPVTFNSRTARRGGDCVSGLFTLKTSLEIFLAAAVCPARRGLRTFARLRTHPVLGLCSHSPCPFPPPLAWIS